MKKLILLGRTFFSIALIGFGIENLITGNFLMAGSLSAPSGNPLRLAAVYFSGNVLIVAGLLLIVKKKTALAALSSAVIIFLWALLRNIPEAAAGPFLGGLWTNAFKAMAIGGGALIAAASYPDKQNRSIIGRISLPDGWLNAMRNSGRFLVSIFLLVCGIQHFMFIDFVAGFIPAYIPAHYFWAYLTGTALIAGGAGLLIRRTRKPAAIFSAIMIFLWVILLHLPMAVIKPCEPQGWAGVCEALSVSGILFMLAGEYWVDKLRG